MLGQPTYDPGPPVLVGCVLCEHREGVPIGVCQRCVDGPGGGVPLLLFVACLVLLAVLHGESSKRLATPRNTENKKHLQSTQSAQPTNLTDQAQSTTERTAWETHYNN